MTATILILVSAISHAIVNVLTKRADDKYSMRVLMGAFSVLFVLPATFFVPLPNGDVLYFLIASGLVHAVYEILLIKSYENGAFSAVYPIARGTGPLFTALGASLFLGDKIASLQFLGIFLVCSGVVAIGISQRAAEGAGKGFAFALATGATIGVYTVVDAAGVRAAEEAATFIVWFWISYVGVLFVVVPIVRGLGIYREARRHWKLGAFLGATAVLSYCAALLAFRLGATAQMAALRETSVLFGTALAVILLNETMTARRWAAAIIVVTGAILTRLV